MASVNFINECKNGAYKNRLGKLTSDNTIITESDTLSSIETTSSIYTNGKIVGSINITHCKVELLEPIDFIDKDFSLDVGILFSDNSKEWCNLGNFTCLKPIIEETSNITTLEENSILRKVDELYVCRIENWENVTIYDVLEDVCSQMGLELENTTFLNSTFVVEGNPFTNNEKIRDVLSDILEIACSWGDLNLSNGKFKVCWFSDDTIAETFDKSQYSTLKVNRIYGPVNKVIIKESQIDGENVMLCDDDSITTNGETQLCISDNYFLNTQEKRQLVIDSIYNRLNGFTYTDFSLESYYGKPYINVGDRISIEREDGTYFESYVLKNIFKYDGSYYTKLEAPSLSKEETKKQNNNQSLKELFSNTQIMVDKANKRITSIVEEVNEVKADMQPIKTISESSLHIKDSSNNYFKELVIEGKCEQDTSIQGKNLLDLTKLNLGGVCSYSNLTSNDITVSYSGSSGTWKSLIASYLKLEDGTYTLSAEASNETKQYALLNITKCTKGTITRLDAVDLNLHNATDRKSKQFTIDNNYDYYLGIFAVANTSLTNNTISYKNIMIEKGNTATDYEPFTPNSPSIEYPNEIRSITPTNNLLNTKLWENSRYVGDGYVGLKLSIAEDGKLKLNGTSTGYANCAIDYSLSEDMIGKTYTLSAIGKLTGISNIGFKNSSNNLREDMLLRPNNNKLSVTFTITQNDIDNCNKFDIYIPINTEVDAEFYLSLEELSSHHSYVPYGSWLKILTCNKNLFDKRYIISNYRLAPDGNTYGPDNDYFVSDYIRVEPNKIYTFNYTIDNVYKRICIYDKNKRITREITGLNTIKINNNECYLRFTNQLSKINDIQLEENASTTEFETSKYSEYLIPFRNNFLGSIGDIKDKLILKYNERDNKYHAYLEKKIGKAVLNGSETWFTSAATNTDYFYAYTSDYDNLIKWNSESSYCNKLSVSSERLIASSNVNNDSISMKTNFEADSYKIRVMIKKNRLSNDSLDGFKEWLLNNNVTIYYELAVLETIDLGVISMIRTFETITNVDLDVNLKTLLTGTYYTIYAGKDGKTQFLHVMFSENGEDFVEASEGYLLGKKPSEFRGEYLDFNEVDSLNFEDYTWYKPTESLSPFLDQLQNQISANNTTMINNYQDLVNKLNDKASQDSITTINNKVENIMTSTSETKTIVEEIKVNGVTQVKTENNFIFDKNGLLLDESGAPVKNQLNAYGMEIVDKTGSSLNTQFFSGMVTQELVDKNPQLAPFLGQTITYTNNLYAGNFIKMENGRWENVEHSKWGKGIGCFIGGGS